MHEGTRHEDSEPYFHFTGRQRFDRAIHTLEGLVRGIGADGKVNDRELGELTRWIGDHLEFAHRHPFNEVIPALQRALTDGVFDEEERYDLIWLCERLNTESVYYNAVTADMQRLQGLLAGIIADKKIEPHELRYLQEWINEHSNLKTCWPYDEIEAVVLEVMRDEVVDEREHAELMAFFSEFTARPGHRSLVTEKPSTSRGICAVCPSIEFTERQFCFTGSSKRSTRKIMESLVKERGGLISRGVVRDLHYLVIGADGNPCWAYACYGRKVEAAITLRQKGLPLMLVHEHDYWDAIEDSGLRDG